MKVIKGLTLLLSVSFCSLVSQVFVNAAVDTFPPLEYILALDDFVYHSEDTIHFYSLIRNISDTAIYFQTPSSSLYRYRICKADTEIHSMAFGYAVVVDRPIDPDDCLACTSWCIASYCPEDTTYKLWSILYTIPTMCTFGPGSLYVEFDINGTYIEESIMPSDFSLSAHPNPFNSAVSISAPENAIVEIFDINGRMVDKIPVGEGHRALPSGGDAGNGSTQGCSPTGIVWTPDKSLGSGVYLVRAKIGDESASKRIVYLK